MYSSAIDCLRKTLRAEGAGGLYKGLSAPLVGIVFYNVASFTAFEEFKQLVAYRGADGQPLPLQTPQYFLAGALTGLAVTAAEHPFDLVKCKMQLEGPAQQAAARRGAAAPPSYASTLDCVRRIARHGAAGWAQGATAAVARNVSNCFWFFGLYEAAKRELAAHAPGRTQANRVAAGAVAGVGCTALSLPLDVCHYALMAEPSDPAARRLRGLRDCAQRTWAQGGARAFWVGGGPALARALLGGAVLVSAVEAARSVLHGGPGSAAVETKTAARAGPGALGGGTDTAHALPGEM
jgi:solute carrier family 25 carnitine/acylcarnitine transporter 20/29